MCVSVLQDVNDQLPVFSEEEYEVEVREDTAVGGVVVTVNASDGDIGDNAVVRYSVGGASVVSVDSESGEVKLVTMLDHEDDPRLEIEVRGSACDIT